MSDFTTDHTSGSGDVALGFLDALERWVAVDTSPSAAALRAALMPWLRLAQASQPSMGLIHQLAARALDVCDTGVARNDAPADLRVHLARSCAAERADLKTARAAVTRTAVRLVTARDAWIATLSHSGLVGAALIQAHEDGRRPQALVAEGRPLLEGRAQAQALAAAGIPVWLVADAALPLLLSQAQMVWIGADAVTERGVVNKIGSYAIALAAREHSVPVYALAESRKFLPASTPALKIDEMPPAEIWDEPAAGVRPRNVYFEVVPIELIRGVVIEDVVLGPAETAVVARERALQDELARA